MHERTTPVCIIDIFLVYSVAPTVSVPERRLMQNAGLSVAIQCIIEAYPMAKTYWAKNGIQLTESGNGKFTYDYADVRVSAHTETRWLTICGCYVVHIVTPVDVVFYVLCTCMFLVWCDVFVVSILRLSTCCIRYAVYMFLACVHVHVCAHTYIGTLTCKGMYVVRLIHMVYIIGVQHIFHVDMQVFSVQ